MIKTVKDLIRVLKTFDADMPVVIRKAEEKGAYSDWSLHTPSQFFPGGRCCLSAFEPVREESAKEPAGDKS